jgi:hypothetical protein
MSIAKGLLISIPISAVSSLLVSLVFIGLANIAHAQQPTQQQPTGPTVEQRLGSAIAALIVENARLATELENARQSGIDIEDSGGASAARITYCRAATWKCPRR